MKKNKYFCLLFVLFFNLYFLPVKPDTIFEIGKDVFLNKAMCGSCHALSDAETVGQIGPNLNQIKPDIIRVISAVTNGIGVMPPYEGTLSMQEIEAVAHYVSISAAE